MVKARDLKAIAEEAIAVDKKQRELDKYFEEINLKETLREVASTGKFCYDFVMEYERYLVPALGKYFKDLGYQYSFVVDNLNKKILVVLGW